MAVPGPRTHRRHVAPALGDGAALGLHVREAWGARPVAGSKDGRRRAVRPGSPSGRGYVCGRGAQRELVLPGAHAC